MDVGGAPSGSVSTPPLRLVRRAVDELRGTGSEPAVGGSGLLVALGLVDAARDWDVTIDAPQLQVASVLDGAGFSYREDTERDGVYATQCRYIIDGGDHQIDLLVGFALRGDHGIELLPTRVSGTWRGLPLADPAVWARAYRLLGRPSRAELLERWLADR